VQACDKDLGRTRARLLACGLTLAWLPAAAPAQVPAGSAAPAAAGAPAPAAASAVNPGALRDGQHDFDFEFGTWRTHISRRLHPLTGSNTWVEYEGTSRVRPLWNGRANLLELEVSGPGGRIEALSLRLYNPDARQWSLNFSNSALGTLGVPTVGGFSNGRGEFFDQETIGGRAVLVRFVVSDITANSCHFEQAFSVDGGRSWEVNWVATDTRSNTANGAAQ
jgi:hypothetical protein